MIPIIERLMNLHQLDYTIAYTERPWHAVELAQQAAFQGYEYVVAAGGDGTVNEVLNGLIKARGNGSGKPALGVFTVGRGNDFAFSTGISLNLEESVHALAMGKTQTVDVGYLTGGLYPQGRIFGNGVGIGFDAVVGFESVKLAPLSGFASYLVAALKTIMLYYHAPMLRIELDDETITQPSLMVSIMNGKRMGADFIWRPTRCQTTVILIYASQEILTGSKYLRSCCASCTVRRKATLRSNFADRNTWRLQH